MMLSTDIEIDCLGFVCKTAVEVFSEPTLFDNFQQVGLLGQMHKCLGPLH